MIRRVLVTGASGFIGSNVVHALLRRGDEVHIFLRSASGISWRLKDVFDQLHVHDVDLTVPTAVRAAIQTIQPKEVFHLAHYGGNPSETNGVQIRRVVIEGTAALYSACLEVGGIQAIIHAGSSSEYGKVTEPMRENMPLTPHTEYGLAKAWATMYGQYLAREKNLPVMTLRFFSAYGPYESSFRFFPSAILACLRQTIFSMANPHAVRDFLYVEDCVEAMLFVANKLTSTPALAGGVFNIGSGTQHTIGETAELIRCAANTELKIEYDPTAPRRSEVPLWVANMENTKNILGWTPTTSFTEGITKTVAWFRQHENDYETHKRTA